MLRKNAESMSISMTREINENVDFIATDPIGKNIDLHALDRVPSLGCVPKQQRHFVDMLAARITMNRVLCAIVFFENRAKEEANRMRSEIARNVADLKSSLGIRSIRPVAEPPPSELRYRFGDAHVLLEDGRSIKAGMKI